MLGNDQKSEIPSIGGQNVFLRIVGGLSLLGKVKSTNIRQSLNIETLLLRIERSQLCWYGHMTRMSNEQTAKQLMDALPSGKWPRGNPELVGGIMLKTWPGHVLEFYQRNCR